MAVTATRFGFRTRTDLSFEQAVARVTAALKDEGFGVLTEIDVKATMRQKLGVAFRKYVILGACNPPLAHAALSADLDIGLLMPCNVIVYESDDGDIVVSMMDPAAMLTLVDAPGLEDVAAEGSARARRVIAALGG